MPLPQENLLAIIFIQPLKTMFSSWLRFIIVIISSILLAVMAGPQIGIAFSFLSVILGATVIYGALALFWILLIVSA